MDLTSEQLIEMYRRILRIRYFDEAAMDLVSTGEVPGAVHTSIGQEASVVGSCFALRPDDYMVGTHRSHGHPIGKGADVKGLMAELLGKRTGVNHGKGGSMHLADFSVGSVGETSIVGSGLPVTAGAALAAQLAGTDQVALGFFGDGAACEGTFHEALNLAAIWRLPAVFLCENNQYAVTTAARYAISIEDVADRASGYGIPGVTVDGQDTLAVYESVSEAVARARAGNGPSLIETKTYRYYEHAAGLPIAVTYRTEEELAEWRQRDPVSLFGRVLIDQGVLSDVETLREEVRAEIDEAVEFARQSPFPDPEEAFEGLYTKPIGAAAGRA